MYPLKSVCLLFIDASFRQTIIAQQQAKFYHFWLEKCFRQSVVFVLCLLLEEKMPNFYSRELLLIKYSFLRMPRLDLFSAFFT